MLRTHLTEHILATLATPPHLVVRRKVFDDIFKTLRASGKVREFPDTPSDVRVHEYEAGQCRWPRLALVEAGHFSKGVRPAAFATDDKKALSALRNKSGGIDDESGFQRQGSGQHVRDDQAGFRACEEIAPCRRGWGSADIRARLGAGDGTATEWEDFGAICPRVRHGCEMSSK